MNFREFVDFQEGCELFLSCDRGLDTTDESVKGAIGSAWNIGSGLARTFGGISTGVSGVMDNNRDRRSQAWKDIKGGVRQVFIGNPKASVPPSPTEKASAPSPSPSPTEKASAPSPSPSPTVLDLLRRSAPPSVLTDPPGWNAPYNPQVHSLMTQADAAPASAPSAAPAAAPVQARRSGASSVYTDDQAPPGWNELVDRWASASVEEKKAIQGEMKANPEFREYYGFAKLVARHNSANSPQEQKKVRDEMISKYSDLLGRWEIQKLGKRIERSNRKVRLQPS